MTTSTSRPARRPRDRKAQILSAALECFHRSGYHATSMEEIAAGVGITAGGLYRHFRGKQELLSRVMLDGLDVLAGAMAEVEGLDDLLRATARFALDHRTLPLLLERRDTEPQQGPPLPGAQPPHQARPCDGRSDPCAAARSRRR
ncbi:TetR/AcrR family transcriptional regulator [Peterkaempfera sp. SMS 1(5)a]|uniref:TetR/AcrR family transcriptional regulator n=1 Tax=Peterkaempfera podocarpi TaxID=3232308 RepID=UPI003673091E